MPVCLTYFLDTAALGSSTPPGFGVNMQAELTAAVVQRIDIVAINNLSHQSLLLFYIKKAARAATTNEGNDGSRRF